MEGFNERLEEGTEDELKKLKTWLFQENVRVENEKHKLKEMQQKFLQEKIQFQEEMKALNRKIVIEQKRLKDDSRFFDKKMEILLNGFQQLDMDRRRLEKERLGFEREKTARKDPVRCAGQSALVEALFKGVNSRVALKKRYKDLIKMYHPDNAAGDHEMIQLINQEYEMLKNAYEVGKKA